MGKEMKVWKILLFIWCLYIRDYNIYVDFEGNWFLDLYLGRKFEKIRFLVEYCWFMKIL